MPNLQIPHLILTVKDFERSKQFYKSIFIDTLGCEVKIESEDFFYFKINDTDQSIGISPENTEFKSETFNRYKVGLHHFAIELETKNELEKVYHKLLDLNAEILDKPQYFPEYGNDYYAFYYLDPDGIKHEFVTFENIRPF
jgi:catechol 2,3-dioxygenase-like lactoylglutathione lyase family enzyme